MVIAQANSWFQYKLEVISSEISPKIKMDCLKFKLEVAEVLAASAITNKSILTDANSENGFDDLIKNIISFLPPTFRRSSVSTFRLEGKSGEQHPLCWVPFTHVDRERLERREMSRHHCDRVNKIQCRSRSDMSPSSSGVGLKRGEPCANLANQRRRESGPCREFEEPALKLTAALDLFQFTEFLEICFSSKTFG
ncbi:hypothetical protein TNCV_2383661 [Trichonephila clavipes]|nr:hypothetical protein TNCV_2383661 [Trichonephila clavipes]